MTRESEAYLNTKLNAPFSFLVFIKQRFSHAKYDLYNVCDTSTLKLIFYELSDRDYQFINQDLEVWQPNLLLETLDSS